MEHAGPILHILRHVEHHRTRSAGARNLKCGAHRGLELVRVSDQKNMLGDRAHDGRHRRFLKCIRADRRCGDLAADDHNGH